MDWYEGKNLGKSKELVCVEQRELGDYATLMAKAIVEGVLKIGDRLYDRRHWRAAEFES